MAKDAIGREWQSRHDPAATMNLPERFDLSASTRKANRNGCHDPRAILGSIERFLGVIIEHFAGEFPVWLAPVQATVLPVSEKFSDYGEEVYDDA